MNDDAKFITDGKDFYISFTSPMVSGFIPVPIPKGDPVLRWYGPKIDLLDQWYPALRFMADHADHEVILRLFMTRERDRIVIFPLTQIYGTGMSVKEDITTEEREKWAQEGLLEAGTMHSHCNMNAFQSGTDKDDESHRDGLHVTIGKLKEDAFDLHARMTWTLVGEERDGKLIRASQIIRQKPELRDWFILPQVAEEFMAAEPILEAAILKYLLTKPPGKVFAYPTEWNTKLIRRQGPPVLGVPPPSSDMRWQGTMMWEPSMADDVPGHGYHDLKKKEENEKNSNRPKGSRKQKADLVWDLWSEALSMIADSVELRTAQIAVSDFAPHRRGFLLSHYAEANTMWVELEKMLRANNVTEEEFFNELKP
jgi:hypothetical protein